MMSRQKPGRRDDYRWFHEITTRWMDNDVFRHVNNVVYLSWFDTAVTYWEMTNEVVDLLDGEIHCVVAELGCRYHNSVAWPDRITVGLRAAEIGIFRNHEDVASAEGHFVHVFVARGAQRPVPIPAHSREIMQTIAV